MSEWYKIIGKAWKFGNDIDTDQILPGYAMSVPEDQLKDYALAGSCQPDFAKLVRAGDVVIGGSNFGCGSSREQAPLALKGSGVGLVAANSFGRIFRRNCINIGLPLMIVEEEIDVETGDEICADLRAATLAVVGKGSYMGRKLSESDLMTLECGGLIRKLRQQLGVK